MIQHSPENVIGVGIDIVENTRIRGALSCWGERFRNRIFTGLEQAYCDAKVQPCLHYGVRFACKEAFIKALGESRPSNLRWLDMEIVSGKKGSPWMRLHSDQIPLKDDQIRISLSHTKNYSVAVVLITKKETSG
ncbi:MAG: holo-ACP synthase [Chlamydiota bacterium]|nr:holo-ACP synthase [Chlamydiota bacterium]